MPLVKHTCILGARSAIYQNLSHIKNIAIIDFSTMGHHVYNRGFLSRLSNFDENANAYTTHISQTDISLGDTTKIYKGVEELVKKDYDAIFIMPSSIASVIGLDLQSIALDLSQIHKKAILHVNAGLNDDYYQGNETFLYEIVKNFCIDITSQKEGFNLLGNFINEYNFYADSNEIKKILSLTSSPNFILSDENSIKDFQKIPNAKINIVTSFEALKTAKFLEKKFKTPYMYLRPYGFKNTSEALKKVNTKQDYLDKMHKLYKNNLIQMKNILLHVKPEISVFAKYDIAKGFHDFFKNDFKYDIETICENKKQENFIYMNYDEYIQSHQNFKGIIFSCDTVLKALGKNRAFEIDNPTRGWKMVNPLSLPLVGFKGAMNIIKLLSDELLKDM